MLYLYYENVVEQVFSSLHVSTTCSTVYSEYRGPQSAVDQDFILHVVYYEYVLEYSYSVQVHS
jgi:hypothetical protein